MPQMDHVTFFAQVFWFTFFFFFVIFYLLYNFLIFNLSILKFKGKLIYKHFLKYLNIYNWIILKLKDFFISIYIYILNFFKKKSIILSKMKLEIFIENFIYNLYNFYISKILINILWTIILSFNFKNYTFNRNWTGTH